MNEFIRTIDNSEFEAGIPRRLLLGQAAVGTLCKVRLQDMVVKPPTLPAVRHLEATISILEKTELSTGSVALKYMFEASRETKEPIIYTDTFGPDSLATSRSYGINLLTYLSDESDPRWDDSMQELVDIESDAFVH